MEMYSVHTTWLLVVLITCFVELAFSIDCQSSPVPISNISISSSLSLKYGKDNVKGLSDTPWVGGRFVKGLSNWVTVHFPYPVILTNVVMTGGNVDVYHNGTLVNCYVQRFLLDYKNESHPWKHYKRIKNDSGSHNVNVTSITTPITSVNITVKKYVGCPAVNLRFLACGVCMQPASKKLACQAEMQRCYCASGYKSRNTKSEIKCLLNGSWSANLICDDVNECVETANICMDNADCTNIEGSYKCACQTGFEGHPCIDINECNLTLNKCHSYADCTNTKGSYKCQCKKGFTGDGAVRCEDIDECSDGSHQCDTAVSFCNNTAGSYECTCNNGYGKIGGTCEDINECKGSNKCDSYADCTNTKGSYKCQCKKGFTGDGVSCEDIDECSDASHQCDKAVSFCNNTAGSYKCPCNNGYGNIRGTCEDIDECSLKKCHKYANCTNTAGSYDCTCMDGFRGDGMNCLGESVQIRYKSTNQELRYGRRLELKCRAFGIPKPKLSWTLPSRAVHAGNRTETTKSFYVSSTLIVGSVTLNDRGSYKCTARNNQGSTDEREINVTIIGTPVSPTIIEKETQTQARSVRIAWAKPSDEGASSITAYRVHYRDGFKTRKLDKTAELSAQINNLTPNTEYSIWVNAINGEGSSNGNPFKSKVTTLTPRPNQPSEPKIDSASTSSVRIRLTKIDSPYETMLQVIVQLKPTQRRKRDVLGPPSVIQGYDKAMKDKENFYIAAELSNTDADFVVGDGVTYGKYKNAELEPGTTYKIYVRGISYNDAKVAHIGDLTGPSTVTTLVVAGTEDESDGSMIGIAVGLTVLFVVIVVVVLLAVIYIRSKRPKTIEIDPETGEKKGRAKHSNSELLPLTRKGHGKRKSGQVEDGSPDPNHPPVPTSGFAKYVGKLHKSDDRGFMIQYNTLETSQTYSSDFGTTPENKDKNRYANIVAYDISRVHLKQIDDDDNSSYINASLIDGYNSANAYIATQGPLPGTFNDFWRMVWERNCSSIVMLTNLQERHKLKCHKYWPEESESYRDITVTATRREQYADYVIRSFLLKMNETEEEREIKQFHFTVWPDHGVPEYPTAILAFQRRVRAYSTRDCGPLVVHCSAGVGRSGTFIVIDCMLARIQNEESIDIYNYVRYLRTRRMYMVQTEEQYVFCHDALLESILCGNTQMAAHNSRIAMNKLRQRDATTKLTGFECEFRTLNKVSPSLPKESFTVATYQENVSKNRYPDILASDHDRVILGDSDDKEEGSYINAVYVDAYKQQNAFILTQAPLKETIKDFWRMLNEKYSACVVLLTDLNEEEGEFPQFWPSEGSEKYDTFDVELVSDASKGDTGSEDQFQQEKMSGDIVNRKFKITKDEDKSLVVKMFQHLTWKETSVPSDISAIISLIQRIEKWQQHSGNGPITVVCNDGQGRSGTFAALCSVLERVKTEQVIDVFQTIKASRIQRPGLVKDVDQYQFIHIAVLEYLDSFSDYANFK